MKTAREILHDTLGPASPIRKPLKALRLYELVTRVLIGPCRKHAVAIADPDSPDWSPEKAYLMARAAQLAYLVPVTDAGPVLDAAETGPEDWPTRDHIGPLLQKTTGFVATSVPEFFHFTRARVPAAENVGGASRIQVDVDAFVVEDDAMILAVFCGTEPLDFTDWVLDGHVLPDRGPFPETLPGGLRVAIGDVHPGFMAGALVAWASMRDHIDRLYATKPRPVYLAGHSLGGALAIVARALVLADGTRAWADRIRGVYTFGQPLVGDGAFAWKTMAAGGPPVFRYDNEGDVVPRAMACIPEYVFTGTGHDLRVTGEDLRRSWKGWSLECPAGAATRVLPESVVRHFPDAYVIGTLGQLQAPPEGRHRANPAPARRPGRKRR